MARTDQDGHIELPADEARQGGRGAHVFVIWVISTGAAALALFGLYALSAVSR